MRIKLRSGTTRRDIPLQPQPLYRFLRHLRRPARDSSALLIIVDPKFRPRSSTATFRLAELAARGGGAQAVGRMLLSDFAERFPTDPHAEAARCLASDLAD